MCDRDARNSELDIEKIGHLIKDLDQKKTSLDEFNYDYTDNLQRHLILKINEYLVNESVTSYSSVLKPGNLMIF